MNIIEEHKKILPEVVTYTAADFYDFLVSYNIIELGIAFIIGTQINILGSDFIDNIISPIIMRFIDTDETKPLKDLTVNIYGANIQIGNFILSFLKFILFILIIYLIFKSIGYKKPVKT